MEKMIDLKDLLKHQIMDLFSAEEQIIEALPAMIDKAGDNNLKKALQEHLKVTEKQKDRLEKVKQLFTDEQQDGPTQGNEKKGFFSRLFSGSAEKCKAMEGLIDEGQKIMGEDISPQALDAAIIAAAQKIEHYEISGYGTACAYARELQLKEAEQLLEQTLNEEYEADDRLTELAVGRLNIEAQRADETSQTASASFEKNETRQGGKETQEKQNMKRPQEKGTKAREEGKMRPSSKSNTTKKEGSTKSNASRSDASHEKRTSKTPGNNKKSAARNGGGKSKKTAKKNTSKSR
jgi:ferritin-like metal-binding protein YciE